MKKARLLISLLAAGTLLSTNAALAQQERMARTAAEAPPPSWPTQPSAPKGAPNVLLIMTDDVGYGVTQAFGGPVPTQAFDALAKEGLRYSSFNTTALCSPTRASLLTGRMPHNVGMGIVTNMPTGYDGYNTVIPDSAATVAETLKDNGYNTAMIGKGHITPEWEMTPTGPYDRWPTGLGFQYFYGFLSADTSMWAPSITENTTPVEPPHDDPDYHFEKDMADHAIKWMRMQQATTPDKPFFMYYAPGLAHTPHHVPQDWLDQYKGKYDAGWDVLRQQVSERQKELGIVPPDADLSPRPESLPAWDSLSADQQRVYARLMEAFAASVAYSDHQTGRLIEEIRKTGELDNTLIIYIQGDNGSSAEGGLQGLAFEQSAITGHRESFEELKSHYDDIGGPEVYNHFPAAWAWALNSPFPWWKQVASQAGGVRNGMVISWPERIREEGTFRNQYAHVSDITPTILEAAGIPAPETVDGVKQMPMDGISLNYSFNAPEAPARRRTQVYEMMENYGIYHNGWMAGTLPKSMAWEAGAAGNRKLNVRPEDRVWTLFNLQDDFTTSHDLSASNPEKLSEMKELFWKEAAANNILPIHDYTQGGQGKPTVGGQRTHFTYVSPITRINEDAAPHTIGHSFTINADVTLDEGANGVIITQGGRFGGYAFYLDEGRPVFHYNAVGTDQFKIASNEVIGAGDHQITAQFVIDEPKPGSAGTLTIHVDGKPVATGRIERTVQVWISHTEGLDVGTDTITAVNDDYQVADSRFSGEIEKVTFTIDR